MPRTAWRTPISGFLLLLATCSEGVATDAPDRCSLAAILAATIPAAAGCHNAPYFTRLHDIVTAHGGDAPTTDNTIITSATFPQTFRILAPDQIRTGQEWA